MRRRPDGLALGHITRSAIVAVAGAVGWVLFVELAILHTLGPQLAKWLITGTAVALASPATAGSGGLPWATVAAVLAGYAVVLLAIGSCLVLHRDVA